MAEKTNIEWCDSTLNLQMGCDGCELWNAKRKSCYAGQLTERYGGRNGWPDSFGEPKLFPHRLDAALKWQDLTGTERPDKPWLNGMPRLIFLDDMGDTFTESLPLDWLAEHLPRISESPHQFLLLTKRAKRMRQFSDQHELPLNVWPGVSVTTQQTANRIDELLQVRGGGPRFVSAGPMWGPLDLTRWMWPMCWHWKAGTTDPRRMSESQLRDAVDRGDCWKEKQALVLASCVFVDQVIFECESGPKRLPTEQQWIEHGVAQCQEAGVAAFVKQMQIDGKVCKDIERFPKHLQVREFPVVETANVT